MQVIRLTDPNALPDGVPAVSTTRVPYRRLRGAYVAGTRYAEGDEVVMPSGGWYLSLENDNTDTPNAESSKWTIVNIESADWKVNHEWNGTTLRFQNPDETWGSYVDLQGTAAPNVQYQYSVDGESGWTGTWTDEKWQRVSVDGGSTWSDAMKFIGDDGADGTDAPNVQYEYSPDGSTGWNSSYTDEKWMRVSVDGGSTWSDAMKFIGDDGADGEGTGDVVGPASSTSGNIVLFDGVDGKLLKDSGKAVSDFATSGHDHDATYSAIGHDHNAAYSAIGHDHDAAYSAIGHDHDSDYAPLADYAPLNGWQSFGNAATTSAITFNVTDNADNQAIFKPGRPLKVGSTYQLVTGYSTGTVTVAGGTLSNSTEYAISYGDFTRVQKVDINLSGAFAGSATTTAIKSQTGDPLYWDMGPGVLCVAKHIIQTGDSAATTAHPKVNVFAGTPTASTTCSGSGTTYALDTLVLSDTLAVLDGSTPVTAYTLDPVTGSLELDASPSGTVTASYDKWVAGDTLLSSDDETDTSRQTATGNLDVAYGERVELKVVKATGGTPGDDAEDLSVSLLFVLK